MQTSEPCYESIKATHTFIYCLSLRQNRRQKVFNKGLCFSAGGFAFVLGGLKS